ncbi:MAG: hypothetical protein AAGA54_20785 [Myxococcota bacterium]
MTITRTTLLTALLVAAACKAQPAASGPATPSDAAPEPSTPVADAAPKADAGPVDDAWGGRIFDRWYGELRVQFKPGQSGGPRGDGSLLGPDGAPRTAQGHSYRLKNFFGWDLRGAEGIYGPDYQNKPYVSKRNLLATTQSVDELMAWLTAGDDEIPAYGEVFDEKVLRATATFIHRMQAGELPGPQTVWTLSKDAPKNYVLNPGADVEAGRTAYQDSCSHCHGEDGTDIDIHGSSAGAYMRSKAYEGWIKVLNGHPGTGMHREIEFDSAEEAGAVTLNIIAALCDRTAFPPMEGKDDVPDGDLRCGSYLK